MESWSKSNEPEETYFVEEKEHTEIHQDLKNIQLSLEHIAKSMEEAASVASWHKSVIENHHYEIIERSMKTMRSAMIGVYIMLALFIGFIAYVSFEPEDEGAKYRPRVENYRVDIPNR